MSVEIPDWLQPHINQICPYCGSPIVNNDRLTDRYCANPVCPEHLAQKVVSLAQWFGIKDCGIAAAQSLVRKYKLRFNTQMIPRWFDTPPSLYLHEVGEICMIKGYQLRWRDYCQGFDTMSQVVQAPRLPRELKRHAFQLVYTESLCNIKPRMLGARINIMMSGSFDKYQSRADFVTEMNQKYGDVVTLVDVGKRKTDVAFLVKEPHATDHEKSAIALERGITIISPARLDERLYAYRSYVLGGKGR